MKNAAAKEAIEEHTPNEAADISENREKYTLNQPYVDFWMNVGLGITFWLGIWPYGQYLAGSLDGPPDPVFARSLLEILIAIFIHVLFGITVSLFVTAAVTLFAIALVVLFYKTLQRHHEQRIAAAWAAAIAALIITIPQTAFTAKLLDGCTTLVIAMIMAYFGASYGIQKSMPETNRFRVQSKSALPAHQFRIRDLLILMVWCAVITTAIRLSGAMSAKLGAVLLVWLITQNIILLISIRSARKPLDGSTRSA